MCSNDLQELPDHTLLQNDDRAALDDGHPHPRRLDHRGRRAARAGEPPVLHFWLGLSVLVLLLPRLLARGLGGVPSVEVPQRAWVALAAKAGHALFYAFMLALPLSGWYAASRLGVPGPFFGISCHRSQAATQGQPGVIADLHETGGTLILWLAGLHALIAVWHHFVLRDGTSQPDESRRGRMRVYPLLGMWGWEIGSSKGFP